MSKVGSGLCIIQFRYVLDLLAAGSRPTKFIREAMPSGDFVIVLGDWWMPSFLLEGRSVVVAYTVYTTPSIEAYASWQRRSTYWRPVS